MLKLTVIETILTEAAEEKVINHYKEIEDSVQGEQEEDEWDRMGIKRPDFLEKKKPQEPDLTDEDFETLEKSVYIDASEIVMAEELEGDEVGSKVYLKSQYTVTVKESPEEVSRLKTDYLNKRSQDERMVFIIGFAAIFIMLLIILGVILI